MTIDKAILNVDARKPNALPDEPKAAWLIELEGRICGELILRHAPYGKDTPPPEYPQRYPEDGDMVLLVPPPYDNLYELYLEAMIDYYNREMAMYANSYAMFNAGYDSYCRQYTRTHMPNGVAYPVLP